MDSSQNKRNNRFRKPLLISLVASLTLGLAPFQDPHVIGKWKWVLGGAVGMQPLDWFDFILHTTPFLALLFFSYKFIITHFQGSNKA